MNINSYYRHLMGGCILWNLWEEVKILITFTWFCHAWKFQRFLFPSKHIMWSHRNLSVIALKKAHLKYRQYTSFLQCCQHFPLGHLFNHWQNWLIQPALKWFTIIHVQMVLIGVIIRWKCNKMHFPNLNRVLQFSYARSSPCLKTLVNTIEWNCYLEQINTMVKKYMCITNKS